MNKQNSNPFTKISQSLSLELQNIDDIIIANGKGRSDLIAEISGHLVNSGGKRIRAILTILCAKICGYREGNSHYNLAACVEMIHGATLLHDDVVDNSFLRRGKKTANALWDNKASILIGDYLLSASFQMMVKEGSLEVLEMLSQTSKTIVDGEVMQLTNSSDITISEKTYLQIIACKTAILFAATTSIGAIITNSDLEIRKSLSDFGKNLGIAFQIADDVLDYSSDSKKLGKDIGDDFFEGKVTLPIIITYQKASDQEKLRIKEIFANNLISSEKSQESFEEIISIMKKYHALEDTMDKALQYQNLAKKNLEIFKDSSEKNMLLDILEYSVSRLN